FEKAATIIELSHGIYVGDEVVAARERPRELDLHVPPGLANADTVFLTEAIEQLNPLLQHAVPAVPVRVVQWLILIDGPLAVESSGRVFPSEICGQGLLEDATEKHGCPGILLLPAIQIAVTIASRAS